MTPLRARLSALAMMLLIPVASTAVARDRTATAARDGLQEQLDAPAQRAPAGLLGVAVLDPQSGSSWHVNADRAYPMMSVFKTPVAAATLARVDRGEPRMEQAVTLARADLKLGSAVPSIGACFHGERMTFTVRQLLGAAVSESDNTAVDALIRLVGGSQVVTALFLRAHGIAGMRVDP